MKRAKYHIMSQTVYVNTEPRRWPIAPDGYIPNSVIRSWRRKEKAPAKMDYLDDIFYHFDECTTNDQNLSTRLFWFTLDEEEEEKKTNDMKKRKKEKEDEKNEKHEEETTEMERKEEDKVDRKILLKHSYDIQIWTSLQNQLNTFDVEPQRQEVSSTYRSRKTVNFLPTCRDNGPKQLGEEREDMKLHKTIEPPLQHVSVPNKHRTSGFIPKESPKSPVVSAVAVISKQEPRNLTSRRLMPPPPTPEGRQPHPDHGPPECPPIRDVRVLLSSTKDDNNIRVQAQVHLDRRVLELYKKFKYGTKNSSHPERLPASKCPSHPLCSDNYAQFAQTVLLTNDQEGYKNMPEWRKNLYKLIALQGFRSLRAAMLAAREHPVESSNARQLAAIIPSLQPGQAAAHQRVVQKVQMQDSPEPAPFQYHHVIPMNSQQNFFTLNPSGKTRYGRLQFDWMRGHDEKLPSVCNANKCLSRPLIYD